MNLGQFSWEAQYDIVMTARLQIHACPLNRLLCVCVFEPNSDIFFLRSCLARGQAILLILFLPWRKFVSSSFSRLQIIAFYFFAWILLVLSPVILFYKFSFSIHGILSFVIFIPVLLWFSLCISSFPFPLFSIFAFILFVIWPYSIFVSSNINFLFYPVFFSFPVFRSPFLISFYIFILFF